MCDYVTYLSISFIYHATLQSYCHQLIIVDNSYRRIVFYRLSTTYLLIYTTPKTKTVESLISRLCHLMLETFETSTSVNQKQKSDITFLQETYSTPEIINEWKFQWREEMIPSHGLNHSTGVLVLINEQLQYEIKKIP